jgi:hypothetical protein
MALRFIQIPEVTTTRVERICLEFTEVETMIRGKMSGRAGAEIRYPTAALPTEDFESQDQKFNQAFGDQMKIG